MKSIKIFGYSIGLAKTGAKIAPNATGDKKRATGSIKKQQKREVSYQVAEIKSALLAARNVDEPNRGKLLDIYDYIMRDGHLKSQVRLAKFKVMSEPWLLYNNAVADNETTLLFQKKWFSTIIEAIIESELYGFSLVELTIEGENISVTVLDRNYVSIEKQMILCNGTFNGDLIPYADAMWQLDLVEFGRRDDLGTLLECAYNVLWKYYDRGDWSRYNSKVGIPILSVVADTNDEAELDDLETRAANFGSDGYIVTQKGDEVTLIEKKSDNGHATFKDNIALCNEEVSKIINGQTGASDQKAYVGAANAHERTLEDFTLARMQNIVDEMNERFIPYLVSKGLMKEGTRFDYPELIRNREKRINGTPTATDPVEALNEQKKDPKQKES